jgi:hypothetical protein
MKMSASSEIFLFGVFRLDRAGGGLFRLDADGVFVPVAIGSRALEILGALVERRGEIVPKEEIIGAGWPRTVVAEGNLFVQIAALRRILDAAQPGQSCIQCRRRAPRSRPLPPRCAAQIALVGILLARGTLKIIRFPKYRPEGARHFS